MSGIHDLALFIAAGLLLNVTPGPDMAYIAARSVAGGFRDGAAAAFGITAGCVVHTVAAAAGLSALLATSGAAFAIVKWCGAAYLLYAGIRLIARARTAGRETSPHRVLPPAPPSRILREAFVINVFNPKVALFFLAFLPQFVDPSRGRPWVQILVLGLLFSALGFLSDTSWALVAGTLGERLRRSTRFPAIQRYVSGTVFLGLGAVAAFTAPVKQS